MKSIFVSIVLLPNKEINSAVLDLNKKICEKYDLVSSINKEDFAHISIYNAKFPEHNYGLIEDVVKNIFEKFNRIKLEPERLNIKSRFLSILFNNNKDLISLQNEIIEYLNPLREGLIQSKYIEKSEFYSKEELENIKSYGYPFCKNEFSPHMTIAEFKNIDDIEKSMKDISWKDSVFIERVSMRILFTNDTGEKSNNIIYFNL